MTDPMFLSIANDFSQFPSGRDDADGPYNGTKFRETLLLPKVRDAIKAHTHVIVSLAGVMSFGSSFFEEAFGGAVRALGLSAETARKVIQIDPGEEDNKRYSLVIEKHMREAAKG